MSRGHNRLAFFSSSVTSRAIVSALTFLSLSLPPIISRADEKPTVVAKADRTANTNSSASGKPDLSKYKKVPLDGLQKLTVSESYESAGFGSRDWSSFNLASGGELKFELVICKSDSDCSAIDTKPGLHRKELHVFARNISGIPNETKWGNFIGSLDLSDIDSFYKRFSGGTEIGSAAVFINPREIDPNIGKLVAIYVVPQDANGKIQNGAPVANAAYDPKTKKFYVDDEIKIAATNVVAQR